MKEKMTTRNIRIKITEKEWNEIEEYLNSRQEIIKGSVYGSAIIEKIRKMKKNGGAM